MPGIALLWPVPSSETTAAAARLEGFEKSARRLSLPAKTIIPVRSGHAAEGDTVALPLYDTYADAGFLTALARLPSSTIGLIRFLRKRGCGCVIASTPAPFLPF